MNRPIPLTTLLLATTILAAAFSGTAWSQAPAPADAADAPNEAQPPAQSAAPDPASPSPHASPPPDGPPFGPRGEGRPGQNWEDKEIKELIETIKLARLSQRLGLDDEQTVQLMRRLEGMKEKIAEAQHAHAAAVADLRELVNREAPEAEIQAGLRRVIETELSVQQTRLKALKDVANGLDAVQAAKLYLFTQDFGKDIRELIQRARMRRMGRFDEGGPPRGMGMGPGMGLGMGPGMGPGMGLGMGPGMQMGPRPNGDGSGPDGRGRGRRHNGDQPE